MSIRAVLSTAAMIMLFAAGAVRAEDRPGPPGRMWRPGPHRPDRPTTRPHMAPLSEARQKELLEALQKCNPVMHHRLVRLQAEDPQRYRWAMRSMWGWYQRWKSMPPEVQVAVIAEQNERIRAWRLVRKIHRETDEARKASLTAELREVVVKHFQCEQKVREHRLERLEEHIRRLRTELAERRRQRDQIVQTRTNRWLQATTQPAGRRRHRPTTQPAE
ncbi:MAG: hypothetical protein SVT52_02385 [Planctomycetota bacterium]|nr:hypothetical protein [Planctomycetota bacterium]